MTVHYESAILYTSRASSWTGDTRVPQRCRVAVDGPDVWRAKSVDAPSIVDIRAEDEGITWVHDWEGPHVDAFRAACAL